MVETRRSSAPSKRPLSSPPTSSKRSKASPENSSSTDGKSNSVPKATESREPEVRSTDLSSPGSSKPSDGKSVPSNLLGHSSDITKNVLISAAYIHLKCNKYAKYTAYLPSISPRILLSGPAGSDIYQETLVKALASHFGASLLIVDGVMLPGGSNQKELDTTTARDTVKTEKAGLYGKRASVTAALRQKKPASSVEADIASVSSLSQPQPKQEASTATSKNYTFKKGDRVKYLGPSVLPSPKKLRGPLAGFKGEVVLAFEGNTSSKLGVRFDKSVPEDNNNLGGRCEERHGFFCPGGFLALNIFKMFLVNVLYSKIYSLRLLC